MLLKRGLHMSMEVITDHLYGAIEARGEEGGLAVELDQIFGWDIDFYAGIRTGDTFRLMVEKKFLDGRFRKYGNILAAEFWNDGRRIEAYRFDSETSEGNQGRLLSSRRPVAPQGVPQVALGKLPDHVALHLPPFHPIRKVYRAHYGVDYAAPVGTPVFATADGTVTQAGRNGAAGLMITLRHPNGYETMYLHLNSILVKAGQRVEMNQRIGQSRIIRRIYGPAPRLPHQALRFLYQSPLGEIQSGRAAFLRFSPAVSGESRRPPGRPRRPRKIRRQIAPPRLLLPPGRAAA